MPNFCWYEMKIKGSKENCYRWLKKMKSYDEHNHFWRMFDPINIDDEGGTEYDYYMKFSGDCAWSLESCCRDSGYSGGVDLFAENTKDLQIKMEAYSSEPGCCFQEHYIYDNGVCIADRCVDYHEIYWDRYEHKSFDSFKKEFELPAHIIESDFDDDGYCEIGGFPNWDFII